MSFCGVLKDVGSVANQNVCRAEVLYAVFSSPIIQKLCRTRIRVKENFLIMKQNI